MFLLDNGTKSIKHSCTRPNKRIQLNCTLSVFIRSPFQIYNIDLKQNKFQHIPSIRNILLFCRASMFLYISKKFKIIQ